MKKYLEAGRLTSQRGIKGEMRFDCWCDSPEFISGIEVLYLDNEGKAPLRVVQFRASIPTIIFEGCETRETSAKLVGKTVYFDRDDIELPEGTFFNDDLIGLPVTDEETGEALGVLTDIDTTGLKPLYTVTGEKTYLIPAVPEFLRGISLETGIKMKLIEGLEISK